MKFVVAVTDNTWFHNLSTWSPDEVNFWSRSMAAVRLDPGTPWLFKLHSPENYIAGGGYFTYWTSLPLAVAWTTFGRENGASSIDEFRRLIRKDAEEVGCTVLSDPYFWDRSEWLPLPPGWKPNIERYKIYDTADAEVAAYWELVSQKLKLVSFEPASRPAFGKPALRVPRLGQGGFRSMIIDAYERRCAITRERTLPALEAAHIVPFAQAQRHDIRNGLLLRADLHRLYDDGWVTVGPDYRFEVSRKIKDVYENGRDYYALHGVRIALPSDSRNVPDPANLEVHATRIYRG